MTNYVITKTMKISGDDCPLATINHVLRPSEAAPFDLEYIADNGKEVGILARKLFEGSVTVNYSNKYSVRASETQHYIHNGYEYICEASFLTDDCLFAAIDILHVKQPGNHVEIIEVKSATKMKDIFYSDLAFQVNVVESCGFIVDASYIALVNSEFVKHGEIDPKEFFIISDVSEDIRNMQPAVKSEIDFIKEALDKDLEITPPPIGEHCFKPYACQYWHKCKTCLPEHHIFDIRGMRISSKMKLFNSGVVSMESFLDLKKQNAKYVQQARLQVSGSDELEVKIEPLKKFLEAIPIGNGKKVSSVDFETIAPATPVFDGMSPYDQIVTQFSIHVYDGSLHHYEYLADPKKDWRSELAHELVKACAETGPVIVWNQTMEYHRIMEMSEMPCNSDIKDKLVSIADRIVDLMVPFRERIIYNRFMEGYYSLKKVTPALYPDRSDLSYKDLAVNNGMMASLVFTQMMRGEMSALQEAVSRRNELTYCELDTLAPLYILDYMNRLAYPDAKPMSLEKPKRDRTYRSIRVGDYVTTNVGNGTVVGFTPCFVRVRLEKRNRTVLRMAHNIYNHSGLELDNQNTEKMPEIPGGVISFYDVTGREVQLGDYVVTRSQVGQVVDRTDYFLKIRLNDGKEVLRCGTFVII